MLFEAKSGKTCDSSMLQATALFPHSVAPGSASFAKGEFCALRFLYCAIGPVLEERGFFV
jgi:hypothetical protein